MPHPDDNPRRAGGWLAVAASSAVLLAAASVAPSAGAARSRIEDGDKIELTGIVTDAAGLPISGLHVVLEASRSAFDIRRLRKTTRDLTRLTGITNERGEYRIEWPWNGYYNTFQLLVGIPTRSPEGEKLRILERVDVTQRIERGSPVVSALVVENSAFVENLRSFLATINTEDERRTHRDMGEPDKVERFAHPDRTEVAWWYFASGKVYRFRDGTLAQVETFDPVKEF